MTLRGIWELKKIALRNLQRHKAKTVLTTLAIMISVAVYIFLNSWLGGMAIISRRNIVNFEMGAAKLQTHLHFERFDELPSYEVFHGWEIYREALFREGFYSAPRYVFAGTLFSRTASAPVLFHGVDPVFEAQALRYVPYIEHGRYVQDGRFEIALGIMAADRLNVGIPQRPLRLELEEFVNEVTRNEAEAAFIRSLYELAPLRRDLFAPPDIIRPGNERMVLRRDIPASDLDRAWDMVIASGRNDVRINAIIDIRAVPETIRRTRWEIDLLPYLRAEDIDLVNAAYEFEEILDAFVLIEQDEQRQNLVLDAMIRAGFTGAIRHVNQLMDVVVVGVINSPAPLPNGHTAFIPLDVLQDDRGMMLGGAVTELVIREMGAPNHRLPGRSESPEVITAALQRGLATMGLTMPEYLGVFGFLQYLEDYLAYEAIQTAAPQAIAMLLFLLSFLGISNTILMAILERTKEIGMMRSMGMEDKQVIMTYMLEAGFIGFIGSVLGIIVGCAINAPVVAHGIDFTGMTDFMGGNIGFRTTGMFYSVWNIPLIIGTGVTATILSACMAFFPTKKAVKMPITDSLRFE